MDMVTELGAWSLYLTLIVNRIHSYDVLLALAFIMRQLRQEVFKNLYVL